MAEEECRKRAHADVPNVEEKKSMESRGCGVSARTLTSRTLRRESQWREEDVEGVLVEEGNMKRSGRVRACSMIALPAFPE